MSRSSMVAGVVCVLAAFSVDATAWAADGSEGGCGVPFGKFSLNAVARMIADGFKPAPGCTYTTQATVVAKEQIDRRGRDLVLNLPIANVQDQQRIVLRLRKHKAHMFPLGETTLHEVQYRFLKVTQLRGKAVGLFAEVACSPLCVPTWVPSPALRPRAAPVGSAGAPEGTSTPDAASSEGDRSSEAR